MRADDTGSPYAASSETQPLVLHRGIEIDLRWPIRPSGSLRMCVVGVAPRRASGLRDGAARFSRAPASEMRSGSSSRRCLAGSAPAVEQQPFDVGLVERRAVDAALRLGRFVFVEQLHRAHAVAPDRLEQIERVDRTRCAKAAAMRRRIGMLSGSRLSK
jgi:hypothetical protein